MALPFFNKKTSPKDEPTTGAIALPEQLPQHVGFIMDGNGRWATKRGMPRKFGHREGAKNFKDLSLYCRDIGLRNASFYVFSTENWKRPQDEVDAIMDLFWDYLCEADQYLERRVRMVFVGDRSRLQDRLQKRMEELEHDSRDFEKMNLILAINYGGRDEIKHATQEIAKQVQAGTLSPDDITEQTIADHLYTAGLPDVDLLIRPSGELRLSNYLIWQCAYAEYYFTNILWPDFNRNELNRALADFAQRGRRFGGIWSMKVRIISGVVGAILAVAILLLHKTFVFPLAIAALICIALFELFRAGKCLHCRISIGAGFLYGAALPFLQYYGNYTAVIALTFLCIIAMFAEMVLLHKHVTYQSTLFIAAITLLVSHSLNVNTLLHISKLGLGGQDLALCSAWVADTGAYFAGTFLGKHKLCPEISPKKTVEGFFGGIVADVIFMVIFALIYSLIAHAHVHYLWLIFIGIVCAVISVLGDLSASVLKRQQGIKDFGNIMPGHGGVIALTAFCSLSRRSMRWK